MIRLTPRQKIEELNQRNGKDGFYGTHNQFVILIEKHLYQQATKIMNAVNQGWLWVNERGVHTKIYNQLLDGVTVKEIKKQFKR